MHFLKLRVVENKKNAIAKALVPTTKKAATKKVPAKKAETKKTKI